MKLRSIGFALGLLCPLGGCDVTDDEEESSADTDGASGKSAKATGSLILGNNASAAP